MQLEELEDDLDNEGKETKDDDYDDWCADLSVEAEIAAFIIFDVSYTLEHVISDKEKENKDE